MKDVVDSQVSKDRGLLRRERGKAAALIEGSLTLHSDLDSPVRDRSSNRYRSSYSHRHGRTSSNTSETNSKLLGSDVFGKAHEYVKKNTIDSASLWKTVSEQVEDINKEFDKKDKDSKDQQK